MRCSFAYRSKVGGEGLLSLLQGLDLAGGEGRLISLQPRALGTDLPEGRLLLSPPPRALTAGCLFQSQSHGITAGVPFKMTLPSKL